MILLLLATTVFGADVYVSPVRAHVSFIGVDAALNETPPVMPMPGVLEFRESDSGGPYYYAYTPFVYDLDIPLPWVPGETLDAITVCYLAVNGDLATRGEGLVEVQVIQSPGLTKGGTLFRSTKYRHSPVAKCVDMGVYKTPTGPITLRLSVIGTDKFPVQIGGITLHTSP